MRDWLNRPVLTARLNDYIATLDNNLYVQFVNDPPHSSEFVSRHVAPVKGSVFHMPQLIGYPPIESARLSCL